MSIDPSQYKRWSWYHPLMFHWMINPGLAINEVFLGQRVPRQMLIEKNSKKPYVERSHILCPHCQTLHPSMKWSTGNKTAFGNWFGLYCDHCEKTIPCLHNLTSLLLWGISYPFWAPFRKAWKEKWLEKQKQKFAQPLDLSTPPWNWVSEGIGFAFFLWIFRSLVWPLMTDEKITGSSLLLGAASCLVSGLLYGAVMKLFMGGKTYKKKMGSMDPSKAN
jgi:hypothetical protein